MVYFSTLFISLFITIALIPVFRELAVRANVVDVPNERKVHISPVPKIGGIAMALGTLMPVLLWTAKDPFVVSLLLGSFIIVASGFADDVFELGYLPKFTGQVLASIIVIVFGGIKITSLGMMLPEHFMLPDMIAVPLTLIVIVGVTNAINLSDGLDGLAGGISLLGFLCIGYLSYQGGLLSLVMFSVAMAGAIFGFLVFNTHPATIFMGDAGSQLLGFMAISLSLFLTQNNHALSTLLPLIILGFPILDTLTVMTERIARGVSPFKADKNHFHHRLMKLGLIHKEAVLVIYIIQSLLVMAALLFRFYSEWTLLCLYAAFAGTIVIGFYLSQKYGWLISRPDILNRLFIGRLNTLRENNTVIKISFRTIEFGLPGLFLVTGFFVEDVPLYLSVVCIACTLLICIIWFVKKSFLSRILRICLYLTIPFVTYLSQANPHHLSKAVFYTHSLSFIVIFIFVILTLKYTRREKGFRSTPMDFLILFIALVLPNFSGGFHLTHQIGLLTVKILIFFFGFEILAGELRGRMDFLGYSTVAALLLVTAKGFI